jgi:exonuclease III
MSTEYVFGTSNKGKPGVGQLLGGQADTDGLSFATLGATCKFGDEQKIEFTNAYGGLLDGANTCVKKGFRYYLVTMKDGVEIDVYITHMNSGNKDGHINARALQFQQLANYINDHRSGRPIVIMGDFNARYTRDDYKTNFWGVLDADLYANLKDAWTEIIWGGGYPEYGTPSWVVSDKYDPSNTVGDIEYGEQDGEVVDKILYINDPQSDVRIFAKTYRRAMEYTWADHTPVVVEFGYEKVK